MRSLSMWVPKIKGLESHYLGLTGNASKIGNYFKTICGWVLHFIFKNDWKTCSESKSRLRRISNPARKRCNRPRNNYVFPCYFLFDTWTWSCFSSLIWAKYSKILCGLSVGLSPEIRSFAYYASYLSVGMLLGLVLQMGNDVSVETGLIQPGLRIWVQFIGVPYWYQENGFWLELEGKTLDLLSDLEHDLPNKDSLGSETGTRLGLTFGNNLCNLIGVLKVSLIAGLKVSGPRNWLVRWAGMVINRIWLCS